MKLKLLLLTLLLTGWNYSQTNSLKRPFIFEDCDTVNSSFEDIQSCSEKKLIKDFNRSLITSKLDKIEPCYNKKITLFFEINKEGELHFTKLINRKHPYDTITIAKTLKLVNEYADILNKSKKIKPALNDKGIPSRITSSMIFHSNYIISEYLEKRIEEIDSEIKYKALYAHLDNKKYLNFYQGTQSKEILVYEFNPVSKKNIYLKKYASITEASSQYSYLKNLKYRTDYPVLYYHHYNEIIEIRKVNEEYNVVNYSNQIKDTILSYENFVSLYYSEYHYEVVKKSL
ncbi:hypothetical protein [Flavobacterium sp. J27]|uniref:hypothetical protein n=1 Tax=Flavobacterium sp. J27 TaxID=2060419 RepID=UPI0010318A3A|nr:hypothetical protein [Flavobacterium sp. J27]